MALATGRGGKFAALLLTGCDVDAGIEPATAPDLTASGVDDSIVVYRVAHGLEDRRVHAVLALLLCQTALANRAVRSQRTCQCVLAADRGYWKLRRANSSKTLSAQRRSTFTPAPSRPVPMDAPQRALLSEQPLRNMLLHKPVG